MNGYIKYNRQKEAATYAILPTRSRGTCMGIMRMLVIHADYRTGLVQASYDYLRHGTGWPVHVCRSAIKSLIKCGLISVSKNQFKDSQEHSQEDSPQHSPDKTPSGTWYVIENYNSWESAELYDLPKDSQKHSQEHSREHSPIEVIVNKKQSNIKASPSKSLDSFHEEYPWVDGVVKDCWLGKGAKLPNKTTENKNSYLTLLDKIRLMHTEDGYSEQVIRDVIAYAAEHWYPTYIGSPSSLRSLTRDATKSGTGETKFEYILRTMNATQKPKNSGVTITNGLRFGVTQNEV